MIGAILQLLTGWKWNVSINLPAKKITPAVNLGVCYPYLEITCHIKDTYKSKFQMPIELHAFPQKHQQELIFHYFMVSNQCHFIAENVHHK